MGAWLSAAIEEERRVPERRRQRALERSLDGVPRECLGGTHGPELHPSRLSVEARDAANCDGGLESRLLRGRLQLEDHGGGGDCVLRCLLRLPAARQDAGDVARLRDLRAAVAQYSDAHPDAARAARSAMSEACFGVLRPVSRAHEVARDGIALDNGDIWALQRVAGRRIVVVVLPAAPAPRRVLQYGLGAAGGAAASQPALLLAAVGNHMVRVRAMRGGAA
jgi:hypothetical protein